MKTPWIALVALLAGCTSSDPAAVAPASGEPADAADVVVDAGSTDAQDELAQSALLPELAAPAQQALESAGYLISVVTPEWAEPDARIALFRRDAGAWSLALGPWDAQVGSKGLSWGRGLTSPPANATHVKVEGDKTAPAGLFRLTGVMGYDAQPPSGMKLPYQQATANIICVDDPASAHYNSIVDTGAVTKDWSSFENMRRPDNLYSLLALVDHNGLSGEPAPVKSGGSCIFMHLWSGPGAPTIGCTALDGSNLSALLVALESVEQTVFSQMPAAEYADAVTYWGLPEIP